MPVWHWWDGTSFWIGAQEDDRKVRNIRVGGTAGLEVDADLRRKRGIFCTGTARLIDGPAGAGPNMSASPRSRCGATSRTSRPARRPSATRGDGVPVVIQLTPHRMISWGR